MTVPQSVSQLRPQAQSSSSGSSTSPTGLFSVGSNTSTEPATSNQGISQMMQTMESAPTPSLCSDNDPEKDDEHDQPPSTPPLVIPSRNMYRFRGTGIPVTPSDRSSSRILNRSLLLKPQEAEQGQKHRQEQRHEQKSDKEEIYDPQGNDEDSIEYEDSFIPIHPATPEDHESQSTVFQKRVPLSPLPGRSPRKPHPQNRRRSTPHTKKLSHLPFDHEDGDEDPLPVLRFFTSPAAISTPGPNVVQGPSLAEGVDEIPDVFTPPSGTRSRKNVSQPSRIPVPFARPHHHGRSLESLESKARSRSRSRSRLSHSKRPVSLGEELWIAQQSDEVYGDELDKEDLYVGTGTRNKSEGFLARGGAGGSPVFMGMGYVERDRDGEISLER